MIFLGSFNKISDTQWEIRWQNNYPFKSFKKSDGSYYTEEEKLQLEADYNGLIVDKMPDLSIPEGKQLGRTFINPQTKEITYEYIDPQPPSEVQNLKEQVQTLSQTIAQMQLG